VRRAVVALLLVAGCETRYGAYLKLAGDRDFDAVELYFGHAIDSSGPGSGMQFASPRLGAQTGLVFDRKFVSFDRFEIARDNSTTYYLPPDDENAKLGAYVAVVVLDGDQPVAIGEYFNFAVPSDAVHEYELALVPYDPVMVDRWGSAPGCIAWKRDRSDPAQDVVAVVQADNRDCDDLVAASDCNDLCTAGSPQCDLLPSLCSDPCAVGCNLGGLCRATLCLPRSACESTCAAITQLEDKLRCALLVPTTHVEIYVDQLNGQMCSHMYQFMLPPNNGNTTPCLDPKLEVNDVPAASGFTYSIAADPTMPGGCVITSMQASNVAFAEAHHFVVSFAAPDSVSPRRSVIVGIQPGNTICEMKGYRVDSFGEVFDCN